MSQLDDKPTNLKKNFIIAASVAFTLIVLCVIIGLIMNSCIHDDDNANQTVNKLSNEQIQRLKTFNYTDYDTLVDDMVNILDCDPSTGNYLKENKSVEALIDKNLIAKMQENKIYNRNIASFVYMFEDSWQDNRTLTIWDDFYKVYTPLFAIMTNKINDTIAEDVERVIKRNLRDPDSFYISENDNYCHYYICGLDGNPNYYINKEGKYFLGKVYFYVSYHAKNGYGGYNYVGTWLYMTETGFIYDTGVRGTGGNEYSTSYSLSGHNQKLFEIGASTRVQK